MRERERGSEDGREGEREGVRMGERERGSEDGREGEREVRMGEGERECDMAIVGFQQFKTAKSPGAHVY